MIISEYKFDGLCKKCANSLFGHFDIIQQHCRKFYAKTFGDIVIHTW